MTTEIHSSTGYSGVNFLKLLCFFPKNWRTDSPPRFRWTLQKVCQLAERKAMVDSQRPLSSSRQAKSTGIKSGIVRLKSPGRQRIISHTMRVDALHQKYHFLIAGELVDVPFTSATGQVDLSDAVTTDTKPT